MTRRRPLLAPGARGLEHLFGLERLSLCAVRQRKDGGCTLEAIGHEPLKISRRRIDGYQPAGPRTPEQARHRARRNRRAFARWLSWRLDPWAPAVAGAYGGSLDAIDEVRTLVMSLASPPIETGVLREWEAA
jgi:hypothetical protein